MEKNLKIYNLLKEVPDEAQKKITGGRLNGMTDIKPMWRIEKLTEVFGPCGLGWYAPIKNKEIIEGANGEKIAIVDINLFVNYKLPLNLEEDLWSEPIEGTGGSSFIANEKNGLYTSDECFKMAYTDALSVACKSLGMGANVYWGDSKYSKPKEIETVEEAKAYKLTFGKYNGLTLDEVIAKDIKYCDWLLYNAQDPNVKKGISMITGVVVPSKDEQDEILRLTAEMNSLVMETRYDYDKLLSFYKVKSNGEMSLEQLRDAVTKLKGLK